MERVFVTAGCDTLCGTMSRSGPGALGRLIPDAGPAPAVVVKDKVGRTRYVAFRLAQGGPLPRHAVAGALPPTAKLTRFDGTHGILRTTHRDRDALLQVLKDPRRLGGREVRFETLATSGTLRKAATALPPESAAARRGDRRQREVKAPVQEDTLK